MIQPPNPTVTALPAARSTRDLPARHWPVALLALTLAACGGGGGDSTSAPVPSPAPSPAPVPAPSPSPSNTAPSITTPPANVSAVAPAAAAFTVVVGGTPTPTIQWQKSTDGSTYANVAGATSATLTLASTAVADSGSLYRAVVTNSVSSVTSAPASLTVALGAAGTASACTSAASYTAGFTYNVVYDSPNASNPSFTRTVAGTVNGNATFNGQTATEIQEQEVTAVVGSSTMLTADTRTYTRFDPSTFQLTQYGSTSTLNNLGLVVTTDTVFQPPSVDNRFRLNVNESTTIQTHQTVTSTNIAPGTTDETSVVTFLRVEPLTLSGHTYQACVFSTTLNNAPTPTLTWLLVGRGVLLKSTTGSSSAEARTVLVNGAAPS